MLSERSCPVELLLFMLSARSCPGNTNLNKWSTNKKRRTIVVQCKYGLGRAIKLLMDSFSLFRGLQFRPLPCASCSREVSWANKCVELTCGFCYSRTNLVLCDVHPQFLSTKWEVVGDGAFSGGFSTFIPIKFYREYSIAFWEKGRR